MIQHSLRIRRQPKWKEITYVTGSNDPQTREATTTSAGWRSLNNRVILSGAAAVQTQQDYHLSARALLLLVTDNARSEPLSSAFIRWISGDKHENVLQRVNVINQLRIFIPSSVLLLKNVRLILCRATFEGNGHLCTHLLRLRFRDPKHQHLQGGGRGSGLRKCISIVS